MSLLLFTFKSGTSRAVTLSGIGDNMRYSLKSNIVIKKGQVIQSRASLREEIWRDKVTDKTITQLCGGSEWQLPRVS